MFGYRTGYGAGQGFGYRRGAPVEPALPTAPSNFAVTPGPAINTLTWTDSENPIVLGVAIHRTTTSGSGYVFQTTVASGVESWVDEDVEAGVTYYYRVFSYEAGFGALDGTEELSGTPLS